MGECIVASFGAIILMPSGVGTPGGFYFIRFRYKDPRNGIDRDHATFE